MQAKPKGDFLAVSCREQNVVQGMCGRQLPLLLFI